MSIEAGLRHDYADLSGIRLHYVEAGAGPLVVLLHGFPDFWYGWRHQVGGLAARGFRVVAPDLRGYNLSGRPSGVGDYTLELLAGDVARLIARRSESGAGGDGRAYLAGHDWGAMVAWGTAAFHPEAVAKLAILNVPHPHRMVQGLRTRAQLRRSWYILAFQLPWLPEFVLRTSRHRWLREAIELDAPPGVITPVDIERYVEAWSRPGALRGMVNYYRAAGRALGGRLPVINAPTRVIWGERDRYLEASLAEPARADVPNLRDVVRLPGVSHWVMRDVPAQTTELLAEFFAAG